MNQRSLTTAVLAAGLLVAGTGLAAGHGQPSGGTQPPAGGAGGASQPQPPLDAKGLRKLIDTRLEEHRQGTKRLEEAMKKLEEGGDPAAINREFMEQLREGRRGGGGGQGNRGERGGGNQGDGAARPGGGGTAGGGGERRSEFDFTGPPTTPEEHENLLKELSKHPQLLAKVNALASDNDEMKQRLIDGVGRRVKWLEGMREKDKEEFDIRVQDVSTGLDVLKLGREVIDAKKSGNTGLETAARSSLHNAMQTRFDTRQKLSQMQLEKLRKQVAELEQKLKSNETEREKLIDNRTDEFLKLMENRDKKPGAEAPKKP